MTSEYLQNSGHEQLGGKAAGLIKLAEMGYTVPGFTTVAHDEDITQLTSEAIICNIPHTENQLWAVRSSANIEDGELLSFAGQFDSILGIPKENIIEAINQVRRSGYNDRAKEYCRTFGIDADTIQVNVIVQKFDEPLRAGVWMSDQNGGHLEWVNGPGEELVSGRVQPQRENYSYEGQLTEMNADYQLTDENGRSIADICREIEKRIGSAADLEFCITEKGLVWLQLRAVTRDLSGAASISVNELATTVLVGEAASPFQAEGYAYRHDLLGDAGWEPGRILVAKATTPAEMLTLMTAGGVVTEMGGRLSHAAVVCRELGKACVVGVKIDLIQNNARISIDGAAGEVKLD